MLVLSGAVADRIHITEAQAVDAETVTVDGTIAWSDGGFSKSVSNAFTNHAASPATAARSNFTNASDPATASQAGTWGDEDLDGQSGDSVFEIRTLGDRPATGVNYCLQSAPPGAATDTHADCLPGGPEFTNEAQSRAKAWGRSGGVANPTTDVNQTAAFLEADDVRTMAECSPTGESWALVPTAFNPAWGNGIGVTTAAVNDPSDPSLSEFVALEPEVNSRVSAWVPAQPHISAGVAEDASDVVGDQVLPDEAAEEVPDATVEDAEPAYLHVSLTSRAYAVEGYALSDLYATVDQYHHETKEYLGSFTMVFARSECGVKLGPIDHQPLATDFESPGAPAYPASPGSEPVTMSAAPTPDENGVEAVRSSRVTQRPGLTAQSQDDVSPTTVASSIDPDAGPETTTMAATRPDDNDDDTVTTESTEASRSRRTTTATSAKSATTTSLSTSRPTTSRHTLSNTANSTTQAPLTVPSSEPTPTRTSTATPRPTPGPTFTSPHGPTTSLTPTHTSTPSSAPEIVIPTEPGILSPREMAEKVGIAEVGDDEFIVVVQGDEVPQDARRGVAALETWLRGGDPDSTWATFVSDDPEHDGWLWAAISLRTGTVVYIR